MLRFHYNDNDNPTVLSSGTLYDVTDADIDIAESHIQQLGSRLDNWQHVILAVEAGFIGAWGSGTTVSTTVHNKRVDGFIPQKLNSRKEDDL